MLQLIEFERFLFDYAIPHGGQALVPWNSVSFERRLRFTPLLARQLMLAGGRQVAKHKE
jgi:hypothetical protein